MPKKKFIQGKKVKMYHNPALMKNHPAGSRVTIMQPFTHSDSGVAGLIPAIFQNTWIWHKNVVTRSISFYNEEVLKTPEINSIESRYNIAHNIIFNLWLSFEHILNDIIFANFTRPVFEEYEQKNLEDKIDKVREIDKFKFLETDSRVGILKTELRTLRDAVMHPKRSTTIYNSDSYNYKTIPHVWLHSESYEKTCSELLSLLEDLSKQLLNK